MHSGDDKINKDRSKPSRIRRIVLLGLPAAAYLLTMAYFAFQPFRPIAGLRYTSAALEWQDGAVQIRRNTALEDRSNTPRVRKALQASGQMTVDIELKTDSLQQLGPAVIFGLSSDHTHRNLMIGQQGDGIELRLRTTAGDPAGVLDGLLVHQVLDTNRIQRITATCDGTRVRLFVDGQMRAEKSEIRGDFSCWGRNQILVVGNDPDGDSGWAGLIWRIAIYDRALKSTEIEQLHGGDTVPDALLVYDFRTATGNNNELPGGLRRLSYRNLFISTDSAVYDLDDCLFNIAGFIPLGVLVYLLLPARIERRKWIAVIVLPILIGLAVSGMIEWVQRYVAGRIPCLLDLIYNLTGTLLGALLAWLAFSTFNRRDK